MAKSITWPESSWAYISLAEDQTEGKMAQEQAGAEDRCSSRASPGMKTKTIFLNTCLILKQINWLINFY